MKKKIHIIEDDPALGPLLNDKIKSEGYDVQLSLNGKDGLAAMLADPPDLVLLDIVMPTMNGYEVLEAKKNEPTIYEIPVVIISNSGQPLEIDRAFDLGVKDYLIKASFGPGEVLEKIKEQLGESAEHDENDDEVLLSFPQKIEQLKDIVVMVVEDDKMLSDLLAQRLIEEGADLMHSFDGADALIRIHEKRPQIIILDVMLPGMDGFEILKIIKDDPKLKDVPVLMLSNLGQQSDKIKAKELGAEHFLVKATVTIDEIINTIRQFV